MKEIENINNVINNDEIIDNKIINEEDNKVKEYIPNHKLELPNLNNVENLNQKPNKIRKSTTKIVDVQSKTDEINIEQIIPNNPMRKDINKPYIIKDEEENIEDINKESKEPINKINISDNIKEM